MASPDPGSLPEARTGGDDVDVNSLNNLNNKNNSATSINNKNNSAISRDSVDSLQPLRRPQTQKSLSPLGSDHHDGAEKPEEKPRTSKDSTSSAGSTPKSAATVLSEEEAKLASMKQQLAELSKPQKEANLG
jgi:hypothetical protein